MPPISAVRLRPPADRCLPVAANDNHRDGFDNSVADALRLLAVHGLRAGTHAREQAEAAFWEGDRTAYAHWLAISRALDWRAAGGLEQRLLRR